MDPREGDIGGIRAAASLSCPIDRAFEVPNATQRQLIMSPSTVLVTGGAGYIGAQTCKALASSGYMPVVYDNLVNGHKDAVRWGPFEHGDVLDRSRLDEVIRKHQPKAVLHFAAFAYVGESTIDPAKYYRNNVFGSLTLLEAVRDHGIAHFVFSSSCALYGVPATLPITEETPPHPINPYGRSKLFVEQMLEDFQSAYGLQWIALRYFNAAGADPDGDLGEDHDPETRIVPLALWAAMGKREKFTIFGTDYDTPDGTCIRDYIHVGDLADAHVRALRALESGLPSGPFNLGVGQGASVREVVQAVEQVTGLPVPVEEVARREGDPAVLISDASRARSVLGWKPARTCLTDIVETAWKWHRSR